VTPFPLQLPVVAVKTSPIAAVPEAAGATRLVGTCCPGGVCPAVVSVAETVAAEATVVLLVVLVVSCCCCPGAFALPGGSCWPLEASTAAGTAISRPTAASI
jgi:hypothetical protein